MKSLKIMPSRSLVATLCLLVTCTAYAGGGPPGQPPTAAECEAALQVTVTDMDFGSYIGGTTGSILMATTGAMVPSGVTLVGGSMGTSARYDLVAVGKNCDKRDVTFAMPASITISNVSGPPDITITNLVNDLATNPFQIRNLPATGIRIGGTLNTTSGNAPAPYTGPFDVSFTFQ